jgi:DNA-directed RNA polymerase specialized sigma24 family protein
MELAKRIAGSFRVGDEDLAAELLACLVELKAKKLRAIQNWKAFLAQSLYNAAKNFFRHEDLRRARFRSMELLQSGEEDRPRSLEEFLVIPEGSIDLQVDLPRVWNALTPELRELGQLLFEEEGNISAIAKRMGRPRKTVEYWIQKLRGIFKSRGIV